MKIPPSELAGYIPLRYNDFRVEVRAITGELVLTAYRRELRLLRDLNLIDHGVVRDGELKNVRLNCGAARAIRAVRAGMLPPSKAHVTTRKQARGAKHWVPRFDRAQRRGSFHAPKRLWFGDRVTA